MMQKFIPHSHYKHGILMNVSLSHGESTVNRKKIKISSILISSTVFLFLAFAQA